MDCKFGQSGSILHKALRFNPFRVEKLNGHSQGRPSQTLVITHNF
jgi:hypothetical protein